MTLAARLPWLIKWMHQPCRLALSPFLFQKTYFSLSCTHNDCHNNSYRFKNYKVPPLCYTKCFFLYFSQPLCPVVFTQLGQKTLLFYTSNGEIFHKGGGVGGVRGKWGMPPHTPTSYGWLSILVNIKNAKQNIYWCSSLNFLKENFTSGNTKASLLLLKHEIKKKIINSDVEGAISFYMISIVQYLQHCKQF